MKKVGKVVWKIAAIIVGIVATICLALTLIVKHYNEIGYHPETYASEEEFQNRLKSLPLINSNEHKKLYFLTLPSNMGNVDNVVRWADLNGQRDGCESLKYVLSNYGYNFTINLEENEFYLRIRAWVIKSSTFKEDDYLEKEIAGKTCKIYAKNNGYVVIFDLEDDKAFKVTLQKRNYKERHNFYDMSIEEISLWIETITKNIYCVSR